MLSHEVQHGCTIVTPDGIRHPARENKARPAGEPVAARERQLCIVQRCALRCHTDGMTRERASGVAVATPQSTQQVLGLVTELIEIGTDGQVTIGHFSLQSTVCGLPVDRRL